MEPRLVVLYLTGQYQILGALAPALAAAPPLLMGPLDFGDHRGSVQLYRVTPTYVLYREIPEDAAEGATMEVGEHPDASDTTDDDTDLNSLALGPDPAV